jgi:O-antigen/teichoic acid export membrane protein
VSRIRANTLALATSFFATAFFAFVQIKILTVYLDQGSVGVWSALVAVGALLATLSELGLPYVLVRYGAKYDAEGRLARLSLLWRFALKVYSVGVVGVILLLLAVGPFLAQFLGGSRIDRSLLILGYLAVASGSLRAFNNASFRGLRWMKIIAVTEIAYSVSVTGVLFVLHRHLTVSIALTVGLVVSLFWAGVGVVFLYRQLGKVLAAARPGVLEGRVLPEVKAYWHGAIATGIFLVAIEQLDKPILASLVTFRELAIFHIASRLALFARRFLYVPFQVMNPEVTHKWESGKREELRRDMELFTKLALGLGISLAMFLAVFARPLLLLVSTREFLSGAPVLWTFTAVLPLLCLYQPLVMFLRATGKVWHAFIGDASWLGLYLGIGSLLVGRFGLPGFVSGQIVAALAVFTYVLTVFHLNGLPRPPLSFYLKRATLGVSVWGLSVIAGRALPEWPIWASAILGLGLAGLVNFFMVRGRFLSDEEAARTVAMLAGRGGAARVARFLLEWPWGRFGSNSPGAASAGP